MTGQPFLDLRLRIRARAQNDYTNLSFMYYQESFPLDIAGSAVS
jgi:hypothetical protein